MPFSRPGFFLLFTRPPNNLFFFLLKAPGTGNFAPLSLGQNALFSMQLSLGNHTSVGRVRTANEDAFGNWLTPNGHLFVVCDGMGGHIGGAIASQQAVAAIYQTMAAQQYPAAPVALQYCLEEANKKLRSMVAANPSLQGMGTTAVVVLVQGSTAFYAHIGDSRLYLFRQNTLRRLTRDHSFVQSLVDQGHITDEEAEKHPRRNEIYRALGIQDTIDPTVAQAPLQLEPGDRLLLCTDGLNGMIGDRGITEVLSERGLSMQQQSEKLVQLADEAGGHDNTTVQLVQARPVQQPVAAPAPEASSIAGAAALPSLPEQKRVEPTVKKPEQSQRYRDAFTRVEERPKPKKQRRPLLPTVGGIALFLALILILYNVFRSPDTPRLGMEQGPVSVDTELINTPIVDTVKTVGAPASDPAMIPPPDISTPPDTTPMPRLTDAEKADALSSDTARRAKKPLVAKPPKKDTARKKTSPVPARATPPATRATPSPTKPKPPVQPNNSTPDPAPPPRAPKAVLPPVEP